jgi:poly-gamma-glutamate synthesis protein (capsule biosynthesis protein)
MAKKFLIPIVLLLSSGIILISRQDYFTGLFQNKNDDTYLSPISASEELIPMSAEFIKFRSLKEKLPSKPEEVSLIAVGDVMLSRGVAKKIKQYNNSNYPFLETKDYLQSGDLVLGNLETPITAGREIQSGEMVFRSEPGIEVALKNAGFNILSLANNHTLNFGEKGLQDTFSYLNQAGIKYVGAGENQQAANESVYLEIKGIKFAFLAYNYADVGPKLASEPTLAFMDPARMAETVKNAKQNADFVIVSMHAGTEYAALPNSFQKNFARAAIDAGAEIVIGHHPHVVETMEKYKGKYIFYSLGNFIFDQMWSRETRQGLILKAFFTKAGLTKIQFSPILIEDYSQPRIINDAEADSILNRLKYPLTNKAYLAWNEENKNFGEKINKVINEDSVVGDYNIAKTETGDLDNDSILENYELENGRFKIFENNKVVWQSKEEWWIDNFVLADSTNDGLKDINLSVWKAGDYGPSKPFWVEKNNPSVKNHFFVFDLINGEIKSVWQSSNLDAPNCKFDFSDLNHDGKNELVVIEGSYSLDNTKCNGEYAAVWQWNGWGFANEWRSEKGIFNDLEIEQLNNS